MTAQAPARPLPPAGYPLALEVSAAVLVVVQAVMSWLAIEHLPATVVPYFSPGRAASGLPGAGLEARLWIWMVVGAWAMLLGASYLMYRSVRFTPIPLLSVSLLAFLAVLRAGVISLNLNPGVSPRWVVLRAVITGLVTMILAAAIERARSHRKLPPALVDRADYDEPAPGGWRRLVIVLVGFGVPALLIPKRVRVTAAGVLVVTAVSYFQIPRAQIEGVERVSPLWAFISAGINLSSDPGRSVRISRRGRRLPVLISVTDPDRFVSAVEAFGGDS